MSLRNFRIGTRLAIGFGSILAIMLAALVASVVLGDRNRASLGATMEAARDKETFAAQLRALSLSQSSLMRNVALHSEIKDMNADEARAREIGAKYDKVLAELATRQLSSTESELVGELMRLDDSLDKPLSSALSLATQFRGEEAAKIIMGEIDPIVQRSQVALGKLIELQKEANSRAISEANAEARRQNTVVYSLAAVMSLVALLVAVLTTRSITRPLGESVVLARRVSEGDLTAHISISGNDEAAQLQMALREMNAGLGEMVRQIRAGSEAIAVGAGEVAAGNLQLSSRTEEHASSIEETASTLEEFTTTARQSAEHATRASQLAGTASANASRGGATVADVVKTMQEIKGSSARIAEIVSVIDGIAFQTNILALNAAVEAARAGEQGRGFAVVAAEVRSLAQRSAASAKEIRGLIDESVGRVEKGAKLAENAGASMVDLVASVKEVADIMGEIASASQEQSGGIEQINRAITQMDHVVQMNASLVEEATAAASSMAAQAGELARSVARFRVEGADESSSVAAAKNARLAEPAPAPQPASTQPLPPPRAAAPKPPRLPVTDTVVDEEWREF
jgi:methyl-accepting chemotaxis protein